MWTTTCTPLLFMKHFVKHTFSINITLGQTKNITSGKTRKDFDVVLDKTATQTSTSRVGLKNVCMCDFRRSTNCDRIRLHLLKYKIETCIYTVHESHVPTLVPIVAELAGRCHKNHWSRMMIPNSNRPRGIRVFIQIKFTRVSQTFHRMARSCRSNYCLRRMV